MKKYLKYLLVLLTVLLMIPTSVKAESKPINIYFFRGDGCSYCAAAESYFNALKASDMGSKFILIDYEVWYNSDNENLMNSVASLLNTELNGVPLIVIGKTSFNGFEEGMTEVIEKAINEEYAKAEADRYDVIAEYEKNKNNPAGLIVMGVIGLGLVGFVIISRKNNKED